MKQLYLSLALTMIFLLSGCCSRYQVFDLLEMNSGSEKELSGPEEESESAENESFTQRVLVDTKTGKMYYFKNSHYLEPVNP